MLYSNPHTWIVVQSIHFLAADAEWHNEHAALVEVLLLQRLVEIIIYILGGPASHLCAQ